MKRCKYPTQITNLNVCVHMYFVFLYFCKSDRTQFKTKIFSGYIWRFTMHILKLYDAHTYAHSHIHSALWTLSQNHIQSIGSTTNGCIMFNGSSERKRKGTELREENEKGKRGKKNENTYMTRVGFQFGKVHIKFFVIMYDVVKLLLRSFTTNKH